jgi:4'-phosphopantetheinyl transferase
VLALYLGGSPSSIDIACTGYGKPFISSGSAPGGLCFNLSHSGDYAVYALSAGRQVGIDIQRSAVLRLAEVVSGGFFSAEEAAVLGKLGEKERSLALLRCWTRKEALVKATGEGVSAPLADITVPSARGRCSFLRAMPGETAARLWSLIDLEVAPGYAASLAVEGDVELREWVWRWSRRVPRQQVPGHLAPRVGPVGDTPPSRSIR